MLNLADGVVECHRDGKEAAKRFKARLPGAVIKPVHGTGHFVPMEKPDECVRIIVEFLAGHDLLSGT